jgi:hypothetical protein
MLVTSNEFVLGDPRQWKGEREMGLFGKKMEAHGAEHVRRPAPVMLTLVKIANRTRRWFRYE